MTLPGLGPRREVGASTRIKQWAAARLAPDTEQTIVVTELACSEPGCPPVETVIGLLRPGEQIQHKIHKPIAEVTEADVADAIGRRDPADRSFDDAEWHVRWERMHELYMPGRKAMIEVLLDVLAGAGGPRRVLDLAGGPATTAIAVADRFPDADVTVLDIDPVLLALATRATERRPAGRHVETLNRDLSTSAWLDAADGPFDAVVVVMALHWFEPTRLGEIYTEIFGALEPGGLFINADRIPDTTISPWLDALDQTRRHRRQQRIDTGTEDWAGWWQAVRAEPALATELADRDAVLDSTARSAEFHPDVGWHDEALRQAGFCDVGVLWRDGSDATIVARR